MAQLNYDDIFSGFLGNITDAKLASLSISDAESLMIEYLHNAISNPYVVHLFESFAFDDEVHIFSFVMRLEIGEPFDSSFVCSVLSKQMVCEWLKPQVRSTLNTLQVFGGKEQKWFSQAPHLAELQNLLTNTELDVRNMIRDRGFMWNSYLDNLNSNSENQTNEV